MAKVSKIVIYIQNNFKVEGEDYDTYKARRKRANELIKAKLSGHLVHVGTYRK